VEPGHLPSRTKSEVRPNSANKQSMDKRKWEMARAFALPNLRFQDDTSWLTDKLSAQTAVAKAALKFLGRQIVWKAG
jgi:hypothetical protein